ncbi:SNF2 helicase associated domain-containing protein [Bacillus pinisoli]|uniref:DEAD/DEAH box helicase n=1 Tax=Bacillus pinisoli TaxID=2901866 RepID=UPI001FF16EFD|nr:DEAD/DEAH box helicase [Bacillus pinisoli]
MNSKLSYKQIKDMCGTVSFKKGETFFRTNKVMIEKMDDHSCEAIIKGHEDFYVKVVQENNGAILTDCTCPKLLSFQKDCQHIAAVLLYLYEYQLNGKTKSEQANSAESDITKELLTIFQEKSLQTSGKQIHFENREKINLSIICQLVKGNNEQYLFGLKISLDGIEVQDIPYFLEHVNKGLTMKLSPTYSYQPSKQYFQKEHDEIIKQLYYVVMDSDAQETRNIIFISSSNWITIFPLLVEASNIQLQYNNEISKFVLSKDILPLHFKLYETDTKGYQLKLEQFNQIIVIETYRLVYFNRKLVTLEEEDFKRLSELNRLFHQSETKEIPIPRNQIGFFIEKVVPGLRKLGSVDLASSLSTKMVKTPLVAKLFLDRVKDRLLAGLEFHYENISINPLDDKNNKVESLILRDVEGESEILNLMDEGMFNRTEGGYYLHNEELEYEFLYYILPKLQKLVQVYATTAVRNRVVRDKVKPQIRVKLRKERVNWLEFKFELNGIADLEIKQVLTALEEKRKYYRMKDGSLLSLETKEFQEVQQFLKGYPIRANELENTLSIPIVEAMEYLDSLEINPIFMLEESFKQFLNQIRNPKDIEFIVPTRVEQVLRDYQKAGYKWMKLLASYGFGGILADDMGLGKTLQTITYILSELSEIRLQKQPVLIVCPSSVMYNWVHECMKFAPELEVLVLDGDKKERKSLQTDVLNNDVVITSYPLLRRDIDWFEKQMFHCVIFDEAQYFKNPLTQTARAVKKIQANHKFALTGTPVENSLEELWSIFHVVFPSLFRGLKDFSQLTNTKISRRVRPFMLRRLKQDVVTELPDKRELLEIVDLLPEQKKLYAAYLAKLRHDTLKHLDKETIRKNRIKILAGITRLRQICCHPGLFVNGYKGSSAKFEQLMRLINDAKRSGRRVLIFSQFTSMLHLIGSEISKQGLSFFYLDGQTPAQERIEFCNQFNDGNRDFFLISLKAGGTGLNLTGADTVIMYDIWWNPAVEEQAADRAYRIGQMKDVHVIKLISKGTIEEKINQLQEKKRSLIDEVIQPSDVTPLALTEEDIRELLLH